MKEAELKDYTKWLAENYRVYSVEKNLWEKNDGTQIVTGQYLPMYYQKSQKSKAKGVFGFLAKLLPFLILPVLPIKPVPQDTAKIDTVRVTKPLAPVAVWVIRKLPNQ